MGIASISLDSKYTEWNGQIYLTGIQALVRLPMLQQIRDREAGLDTAGFVSGYRGSPLGALDLQLAGARAHLERHRIHFQPGINEDLAATAVWGTQLLDPVHARHQGVYALWYGKAPGVDRSGDAIRHGNASGTSPHGGVLVIAGDDHECKSSTLPSQSEYAFVDWGIPVLNPSGVQEVLDYGLYGWALSRFAGCWVGMVALADTMDSSATVEADAHRVTIALPRDYQAPPGGLHHRPAVPPLELERLVQLHRIEAALAFGRANRLDRTMIDTPDAWLGIVTTGKSYLDLCQSLEDLGIDARALGLRVYKVGMSWPLEREGILAFAQGLEEILVVEEKRGLIEDQIKQFLFHAGDARPRVVGKSDDRGAPLLSATGALSPGLIALAIARRLPERLQSERVRNRIRALRKGQRALDAAAHVQTRVPFFCSGCPHNLSTKLPEGSRGLAGIGCHYMVRWMDRNTEAFSQMGGEGAQWIGQAPFSDETHVFANLGDGTYFHSGLLAIRAAVAAGVNITYKILFNDAVAMTGGQALDGALSVPQLTRQLAAEGVRRIAVVTDQPAKYPTDAAFAPGTTVHAREALDAVQRELREIRGCSVLVYDQICAAELRRRRKRGLAPQPERRIFINDAVCEGCGDCSVQSNCVSVEPIETAFGRKRTINQTSCNRDYACLSGLCPAFVSVRRARLRSALDAGEDEGASAEDVPLAVPPALDAPWNLVITGIGGTGVVTLGALIGMAAHLEGKASTVLDMTGLAQKGGAVFSHVRIGRTSAAIHTPRIPTGKAHALLACDLVVAASRDAIVKLDAETTRCVVNTHVVPTAEFVLNNDVDYDPTRFLTLIHEYSRSIDPIDATGIATRLLGDGVAANVFMLGYAYQKGLVPLSPEAIERAIELNRMAVDLNLRAFRWGRRAAHDPAALRRRIGLSVAVDANAPRSLDALIEHRAQSLARYQGEALARRYRSALDAVRAAETRARPGCEALAEAVARSYYKLLAYKDEYEVARLYTDGAFREKLDAQLEPGYRVELHLAPPLFARRDPLTGRPRKRIYGPWIFPALKLLARARALRGTAFDPFGHTRERRMERRLVAEYEAMLTTLLASLSPANHALAIRIAALPLEIRGFAAVKRAHCERVKRQEKSLLDDFLKHEHAQADQRENGAFEKEIEREPL
ncbi:MAG: indolepyruvate ferredoxin oxidoreductase family protein [Myxococcales bacterium]|nr:indolepyruvate ferredoxin oxidoreductase family protein [Myxococcales bacterium]MDH5566816.1 indolepyruvate ferredoxin oxidoreductase family protein [Myxococcales bacterium]